MKAIIKRADGTEEWVEDVNICEVTHGTIHRYDRTSYEFIEFNGFKKVNLDAGDTVEFVK